MLHNATTKSKKYITDTGAFQRVCAWCMRVKVGEDWLSMRPNDSLPLTHGLCPNCYSAIIAKLEREEWRYTPASSSPTPHAQRQIAAGHNDWLTVGHQGKDCRRHSAIRQALAGLLMPPANAKIADPQIF